MSCEAVQRMVIDLGLDPASRRRLAEALCYLEMCESYRTMVGDFDRVRALLSPPPGDETVPAAGWEAFEAKLLQTRTADPVHARRWSRMTLAVAASLVLGLMGLIAAVGVWLEGPSEPEGDAMAAKLTTAEVSQRTREFTEINRVFDGRAGWVLLAGAQSDLGLVKSDSTIQAPPLLLRLNLSRAGQLTAEADVLIVPGQTAELTIPTLSGSLLQCRVATSATDQAALSLRAGPRQENQALLTTNLRLRGNAVAAAGQLVTPEASTTCACCRLCRIESRRNCEAGASDHSPFERRTLVRRPRGRRVR